MSKELTRDEVMARCDDVRDIGHISYTAKALRDHDAALRATIQQQADKIAELESTMTCMYEGHRVQLQDADTQIVVAQQQIQQLEAQVKELEAKVKELDTYPEDA